MQSEMNGRKILKKLKHKVKNALMTADYVDMVVSETIAKIKALTLKQK
jgi:hypothetical protein